MKKKDILDNDWEKVVVSYKKKWPVRFLVNYELIQSDDPLKLLQQITKNAFLSHHNFEPETLKEYLEYSMAIHLDGRSGIKLISVPQWAPISDDHFIVEHKDPDPNKSPKVKIKYRDLFSVSLSYNENMVRRLIPLAKQSIDTTFIEIKSVYTDDLTALLIYIASRCFQIVVNSMPEDLLELEDTLIAWEHWIEFAFKTNIISLIDFDRPKILPVDFTIESTELEI